MDDVRMNVGDARVYVAKRVAEWFSGAELGWDEGGFTLQHPDIKPC